MTPKKLKDTSSFGQKTLEWQESSDYDEEEIPTQNQKSNNNNNQFVQDTRKITKEVNTSISELYNQQQKKVKISSAKLQQFQVTPVRQRDAQNPGDVFDEDDDQEVDLLCVDSLRTTKNRVIEASKKRVNEQNNAFDPTSLKSLAANPELVNKFL